MSLIVVTVLFSLGWATFYLGNSVLSLGLVLLAFLLAIGIGTGWVPNFLMSFLLIDRLNDPKFGERNILVVIGLQNVRWPSGHFSSDALGYSRIYEAARLYQACLKVGKKCKIIVTGGDPKLMGRTEAEVMKEELISLGIPEEEIISEAESLNSFQNVRFSCRILSKENCDQVFVVTSNVQVRRTLGFFRFFGFEVTPAPSDFLRVSTGVLLSSYQMVLTDIAFRELVSIGQFNFFQFMKWNKKEF